MEAYSLNVLDTPLDDLELSVRSYNALKNDNLLTIGDIVQTSEAELLRIPNFGKVSLNEVKMVLGSYGVRLGMDADAVRSMRNKTPPSNAEFIAQDYT